MRYREFIDSLGSSWKVWNTVPLAGAVLTGELKDAWLTLRIGDLLPPSPARRKLIESSPNDGATFLKGTPTIDRELTCAIS